MRIILLCIALYTYVGDVYAQSCDIDGVRYYTYADIAAVLQANECSSCHSANANASDAWLFESYDDLLAEGSCGTDLITHGNAGASPIYTMLKEGVVSCSDTKSFQDHRLPPQSIEAIEAWINSGATEQCIPLYEAVSEMLTVNQCNSCHSVSSSWSGSSYEHTVGSTGSALCDDLVVSHYAAKSTLYQAVSSVPVDCEVVPADHPQVSEEDQRLLRDWINAGAPVASYVLPVELEYFDVQYTVDNQNVQLIWRSSTEVGTDRYIVERSLDGRSFHMIGDLKSAGGINVPTDYLFTDFEDYLGTSYYRLLIVDIDGSSSFSHIVTARLEPEMDLLEVKPTLVRFGEDLNVLWHAGFSRTFTYGFVVDYNGREVSKVDLSEGMNTINLPHLQRGMYYLIIYDFFGSQVIERFVVVD